MIQPDLTPDSNRTSPINHFLNYSVYFRKLIHFLSRDTKYTMALRTLFY